MDEAKELPADINRVVKKEGSFGRKPCLGWKCFVKFKVNGELGDEIKSDYLPADAAEITIGDADWLVDKGIEACIEMMHVGEESTFTFKINENDLLSLDISLEKCEERAYIFQWSDEEKREACREYKLKGVTLFRINRVEHAFYKFSKAVKMILLTERDLEEDEEYSQRTDMLISLYNNLANCQFQRKNYNHVIELCNKSVNLRANVKGYFWRALAYIEFKDYENAECDILELLKIEPGNKAAIEKYRLVRELNKQNRDNYETIVRNMFRCPKRAYRSVSSSGSDQPKKKKVTRKRKTRKVRKTRKGSK